MLKGFKDFIMRGNVIDLAVAVVIGAAFTAIIGVLVDGVINPAIGALFNTENLGKTLIVTIPTSSGGSAEIMFGALIAATVQFVLVAAAVYFALVLPVNKLKEHQEAKRKSGAPDEEVAPDELMLLTEIRDLLAKTTEGRHAG
ncbi:MAG: large conductance mechanosensitive channel protein MscL [Terrimesophilobacter sp.]